MLIDLIYYWVMAQQKTKKSHKKSANRVSAVSRRGYEKVFESDGTYLLKLVAFVLLGMFWIRFQQPISWMGIPMTAIPAGLLLGLILVNRLESHQSDRKIWYAILIVVGVTSLFWPSGIVI
jgi:hypothetical protein